MHSSSRGTSKLKVECQIQITYSTTTPRPNIQMDAPEDRDIKLQKVSGDLLLQFRQSLPHLLYDDSTTERVRSSVDKNEVDALIVLVCM